MNVKTIACFAAGLLLLTCRSAPVAAQSVQYTVQAETVSFEPAARAVVNRLRAHGYDAYFESHTGADGRVVYKVRFGRFANRTEADEAVREYRRREQRDGFVVQASGAPGAGSLEPEKVPEQPSAGFALQAPPAVPGSRQNPQPRPGASRTQTQSGTGEFYTVQIAAKTDRSFAQAFVDGLQRKGYPAYVVEPDPADAKKVYRIRFGTYATRAQAEQAGSSYAEREQGDFLVVLSPPGRHAAVMTPGTAQTAPVPATTAEQVFTVQVCVSGTRESAEKHAEQVRAKGFEPYIKRYEAPNGKALYRVRIGSFQDRSRADELARAYALQGGRDYLVVRTEQEMPLSDEPVPAGLPAAAEEQPAVPEQPSVEEPASDAVTELDRAVQESPAEVQAPPVTPAPVVPSVKPAGWPDRVAKVYAYTGPDNELNLTNAYAKIPKQLLGRIQYVSVFPVMLLDVPETGDAFVMEVEGSRRMVRLAGIRLPAENRAQAVAGIKELLAAEPLRLKYSPAGERSDMLTGSVYYRAGADVQIELIKRGLALMDESSVPAGSYDAFQGACARARDLRAGIWAEPAAESERPGNGADVEQNIP